MNAVLAGKRERVFVVQETFTRTADGAINTKFDLSDATKFGDLVFIFGHGPVALMPGVMRDGIIRRLREEEFDAERDYLLTIGDSVISFCLAGTMAVEFGVRDVRILRWDRRRWAYDVINYSF